MKKLALVFSLAFVMVMAMPTYGQLTDPGDGSGGTGGHDPVGGGAPVGSGLALILGLGLAYGAKKAFNLKTEEE